MALPFETRGSHLVIVDNNGKVESWITTHGTLRVFARGVLIGEFIDLTQAAIALENALTPIVIDPTSPDDTEVPGDAAQIIDSSGATWTLDSVTHQVIRNGQWFNGGAGSIILWFGGNIYVKGLDGNWYLWTGTVYTNQGPGDPRLPPVSAAWFTVPDDGASLTDLTGATWSLGTQHGLGFDLLKNGVLYGGGWAKRIKLDDDLTTVWHESPTGLGWFHEDPDHTPDFWFPAEADPEGGGGDPVIEGSGVTSGSISAGSNILTVADTTSWTDSLINQNLAWVIVEIGKEPGQGAIGTRGVNGQWPAIVHNTAAQLLATTGSTGQHKGALDSGDVYAWFGGWQNRAQGAIDGSNGSLQKIQPYALVARVLSIPNRANGQMVLDRTAAVSVTGAACYLDGTPIIQNAINNLSNGSNPSDPGNTSHGGSTIAGPFDWSSISLGTVNLNTLFPGYSSIATGGAIQIRNKRYVCLTQNSTSSFTIFAPKGAPGAHIEVLSSVGVLLDKLNIVSNWKASGYCYQWGGSTNASLNWPIMSDFITDAFAGAIGCAKFVLCSGCEIRDSTVKDGKSGLQSFSCENMMFRRVHHIRSDPPLDYDWYIQHMNSPNSWQVDCTTDSDHLHACFELFQQAGGGIVRPTGRNGCIALNDCGSGWQVGVDQSNTSAGGGILRFTTNALVQTEQQPGSVFVSWFTPAIQASTSQGATQSQVGGSYPSGYKGIIQGITIAVDGYLTPTNDTIIGIKINENNPDIRLIGNVYQGKNAASGGRVGGSVGIQTQGLNCLVQGNTITGSSIKAGQSWNIYAERAVNGGGNVTNTPDDRIGIGI